MSCTCDRVQSLAPRAGTRDIDGILLLTLSSSLKTNNFRRTVLRSAYQSLGRTLTDLAYPCLQKQPCLQVRYAAAFAISLTMANVPDSILSNMFAACFGGEHQ